MPEKLRNNRFLILVTALYGLELLLLVGFAMHTDKGAKLLFGKYSMGHLAFLAILAITAPFIPAFAHYITTKSKRKLSTGKEVIFTPRKKAAFLLASMTVLVLLVETVYQTKTALRPIGRPPDYLFGFHPFLQLVPEPMTYPGINRHGFKGPDFEKKKKPSTYRIFCLGGSTTLNPFLKVEESYPFKLWKILKKRYPDRNIQVQNAGMSYYTSQHSLINYLIRVKDFEPDMVVIFHGINDLVMSFTPPQFSIAGYDFRSDYSHYLGPQAFMFMDLMRQREPTISDASIVIRSTTNLFSARFFSDLRFKKTERIPWEVDHFPSLASFRRNMEALCHLTEDDGVILMLATQPFLYKTQMSEEEKSTLTFPWEHANDGVRQASISSMIGGMKQFNATTEELAKNYHFPLVNLEAEVTKSLTHFSDDVHFTPRGTSVVAKAIAEKIIQGGYLEDSETSK